MDRTRLLVVAAIAIVVAVGFLAAGALNAGVLSPARATATAVLTPAKGSPEGGISEQEAIRIAVNEVGAQSLAKVAGAVLDRSGDRWVWRVQAHESYGPTSCAGFTVVIDYWTGEVLEKSTIVC